MADQKILYRLGFQGASGLPTDKYVNDFVFDYPAGGVDQAAVDSAAAAFGEEFYNFPVPTVGDEAMSLFMSTEIDRSVSVQVAAYDITAVLGGGAIGSPLFVSAFDLGDPQGGVSSMPSEVAIALSVHGDLTGIPETEVVDPGPPVVRIRPAARRRGRVFIGPWTKSAASSAGAGVFIDINLQSIIVAAAANFLDFWDGAWHTWSRANGATYEIVGGFLDNAFDTQRRRGEQPNGRTLWP